METRGGRRRMNILALDLGTKTGWALFKDNQTFSGVENFCASRFSGGGMRFLRFCHFLDSIKHQTNIDAVYFEEVRKHLGVDAAHIYGGFLAHLTSWCEQNNISYQGVSVGTIKKHASGKGNASKEEIMKSIKEKGFNPLDDNEADAIALLLFARDKLC